MESAVADEVESVRVPPAFGAGEVGVKWLKATAVGMRGSAHV
jgi:hypothetical protein